MGSPSMRSWSILPITLLLSLAGESNAAESNPLNTGNQCYCGVPNAGEDRIIGGEDAGRGEFPWQVMVYKKYYFEDGSWHMAFPLCGGVLISDRHVLTTPGCISKISSVEETGVALGTNKFSHSIVHASSVSVVKRSDSGYRYPDNQVNDIAVLTLSEPIDLSSNPAIKPICLPSSTPLEDHIGEIANIAGWGFTQNQTYTFAEDLQKIKMKILGRKDCGKTELWSKEQFCAGSAGYMAEDQLLLWDEGGPLMAKDKANNGAATLVGLFNMYMGLSPAHSENIFADRGYQPIFTDVQHYVQNGWLLQEMGDFNTCPPPDYSTWTP